MLPKLTTNQRLELIRRVVVNNESVSTVCSEAGISRTLFYFWLRRYKEIGETGLKPGGPQGREISSSEVGTKILDIIKSNPSYSTKKISEALGTGTNSKPILGNHGVQNFLEKRGLSREKDRIKYSKSSLNISNDIQNVSLSPAAKARLVESVIKDGLSVSDVCRTNGVSRPTFYKLKRRYLASPNDPVGAMARKKPKVQRFWRQTPEKYEQAVLSLIGGHPEYSLRALLVHLPTVSGAPIVGWHALQNILRRYNLSTYEQRLAYAQSLQTPMVESIGGVLDKVWRFFNLSLELRSRIVRFVGAFALSALSVIVVFGLGSMVVRSFMGLSGVNYVGLFFAALSLFMGSVFFLYSLKYYLTLGIVLSYSQQEGTVDPLKKTKGGLISLLFGLSNGEQKERGAVGLKPDLQNIKLERYPFISIHIPFYNERYVVERAIAAATSFDYRGEYEVILCDDSTDETSTIIRRYQESHLLPNEALAQTKGEGWAMTAIEVRPGVTLKHLHRTTRHGFKGAALELARTLVNPKTEFISIFDADFVPYPDSLDLFLKYFKVENNLSENYSKSRVAVVQGYQWHVLNKSENWVTRGVRSEYSGSYVVERSGTEIYGGLKQISGSVYMIRRDVLDEIGWGESITEDFELTLKLYNAGYKVVYTPYIQAPAECVSTLKRLIRQRMRWAEGHSQNIKKMFGKLLRNPKLSLAEKVEFVYLSPYYLQAFFFLVGTISWLLAETVFPARLPFWTSLWGWSLVLTNMLALPLVNAVGMFLEESSEKDYFGLGSFMALSYILVPFQAYAAIKGFLEKEEGTWFRTPKTGKITDVFTRGKFYKFIAGILPKGSFAPEVQHDSGSYLALATANSQFNKFAIKGNKNKWLGKLTLSILLIITVTVYSATKGVPEVLATDYAETQYLANDTTATLTNSWKLLASVDTQDTSSTIAVYKNVTGSFKYYPGVARGVLTSAETKCGTPDGRGWIFDVPFQADGSIASGAWTFNIYESDADSGVIGHLDVCVFKVTVSGGAISGNTLLFETEGDPAWATTDVWDGAGTLFTDSTSSESSFSFTAGDYLYLEYWNTITTKLASEMNTSFYTGENGATDPSVTMPTITIPENLLMFIIITPAIPFLISWLRKRKEGKLALYLNE